MTGQLAIIGYGNELRRDDGVGPRIARMVADWQLPGVVALAVHQLTPELAELIGKVDSVVFVDAGQHEEQSVRIRRVEPAFEARALVHACDPKGLLALTAALYGRRPEAALVSVHASDLTFGFGLSPTAERGLEIALERIRAMAHEGLVGTACAAGGLFSFGG